MTPEDMARLHQSAFTRQRGWSAQEFRALLAQPGVLQISASNGFGLIRVIAPEAELLTIAVSPNAQGQGLGGRLLRSVLKTAEAFGASEVFLEVAAENAPALALYDRAGFARIGTRPHYYRYPDGSREDAILMRRHGLPGD